MEKPVGGETLLCANIKVESGPGNNIPTRNIYFPNPGLPEFHGIFAMGGDYRERRWTCLAIGLWPYSQGCGVMA